MAESFADLKRKTQETNEKLKSGEFGGARRQEDPRFWYPKRDGEGAGTGIIRFLPPSPGSDVPFVSMYQHRFQGNRGWFIENCLTSIEKDCPVCNANGELWNSGVESNKDIARDRKRKIQYFANIYVVKDPGNPENEGQIKVLKFGAQIQKMLSAAAKPKFEGEEAVDPFDPFENGANFFFRVLKEDGQTTYKYSKFDRPGRMFPTDDEIEEIWRKQHDLSEFVDPSLFMDYDRMEQKFLRAVGQTPMEHTGPSRSEAPSQPREEPEPAPQSDASTSSTAADDDKSEAQDSQGGTSNPDDDILKYLNEMNEQ